MKAPSLWDLSPSVKMISQLWIGKWKDLFPWGFFQEIPPVILITRKITKDKRPVVDFRLLYTRIRRHNTATPLLRDIYQMLGKSHSEILSCVDLKDARGRYCLYSDTSKTHTGSALWQFQYGKPRLIGYESKSLPPACANYSITELEMTGLLYNMNMWKYYLGRNDFDVAVDHAAIPHIMKSKNLPATSQIIRLLEALSYFTFHLYYVKVKDMILCDFL